MPSTTITISSEAHALLKKFKQPGETFTEVILEHFGRRRPPVDTAGELLERLESLPPPMIDEKRLKIVQSGRVRRSRRSLG